MNEENGSEKPDKSNNGSRELPRAEQVAVERMTEENHVPQDPQMGPSTLES